MYRTKVSQQLLDNLATAIDAEYHAIRTYEKLAQLTTDMDFRTIILNIRNDEVAHFRNFSQIYSDLTDGRQAPLTAVTLPTDFREGIEESLRDELEDSKFYQDTAAFASDPRIAMILRDASGDEARHATWFSYIWNKTK